MFVAISVCFSFVLFSLRVKKNGKNDETKEEEKKKKEKNINKWACMYSVSVFLKHVYGFIRIIFLSVYYLWEFVCELLRISVS